MSYSKEVKLQDNEIPAKINVETGEVVPVKSRTNNIPEGKQIFEPTGAFKKDYTKSWEYLDKVLTPLEFKAVAKLCRMAKMNTNSLEPFNGDTAIGVIADELNIGRNKVTPMFKRFFNLGVYAKFEVALENATYTKYWILNPYLSFSGKLISSDIAALFKGTVIERIYHLVL